MAVVYRYVDIADDIIKYVGIVWSGNRTLKQRVEEHSRNDEWCKNGLWKIEYLKRDIRNRTDAELLEAHYIGKFNTGDYFNVSKKDWGKSELLHVEEDEEWILFSTDEEEMSNMTKEVSIANFSCGLTGSPFLKNEGTVGELPYCCITTIDNINVIFPEMICIARKNDDSLMVNTNDFISGFFEALDLDCEVPSEITGLHLTYTMSEVTGEPEFFQIGPFKFIGNDITENLGVSAYWAHTCEYDGSVADFITANRLYVCKEFANPVEPDYEDEIQQYFNN